MITSAEHFKLVNESTFQGNLNTGQAIDPYRQRLDEKQQQFAKMKKLEYNDSNFIANQTSLQSHYGRLK